MKKILHETKEVILIAATKYVDYPQINQAIDQGIKVIGENRIQDLERKLPNLRPCEKHFIGHLQSNKTRKAVEHFDCIQSVDSMKLADLIDKHAGHRGKIQDILIQVNIGREPQKAGVHPDHLQTLLNHTKKLQNVNVKGLMCIPPQKTDPRHYFREMRQLKDKYNLKHLSMGMSSDYRIAIQEGATMVRIGSLLFS
ncbi:MAG: YggS family pyridoxal phosphate-dependent enzyme [Nanobdellota archaeon]